MQRLLWVGACALLFTACDSALSASPDAATEDANQTAEDANVNPNDADVQNNAGTVEITEEDGLRVVTFTTSDFVVAPLQERYICQNFSNPLSEDVAIVKSQSSMTAGSHHLFAFQQALDEASIGELEDCSGLEFGPSAHSAQTSERTTVYPDGVARAWSSDQDIRIQAHYLNVTSKPITARIVVKLYTTNTGEHTLSSSLFFNNVAISIAPNQTGAVEHTCTLPQDIELMNTVSHMHRFGTRFEAKLGDGTTLYETSEWSEPVAREFDPPLHLPAGTEITYRCEYQNTSNQTLTFGESAQANEMCIFTGQFYPANNGGIVCM